MLLIDRVIQGAIFWLGNITRLVFLARVEELQCRADLAFASKTVNALAIGELLYSGYALI